MTLPPPPSEELWASAHVLPTLFPVLVLRMNMFSAWKGRRQHLRLCRKTEQWSKLPVGLAWWDTSSHSSPCLPPDPPAPHKWGTDADHPHKSPSAAGNSLKSTLMCHQGGLCSTATRAAAIKGKFPFYALRSSAAGSHDSPRSLIYHPVALFL